MARFIVHTAPYHVQCANDRGIYWHDGVFLHETTGNEALVTSEGTEKPVLTVIAAGPQPGWFLKDLSRTLLTLLEFWPGLDKTLLVGCPTRDHNDYYCKGGFKLDFLTHMHKVEPDAPHACQVCYRQYSARELLFGYAGVAEERKRLQQVQEYFYAKQEAVCPRAYMIEPVIRSWYDPSHYVPERLGGKKLRLTLLSEYSRVPIGWS
jgi:hypothetical protein